MGGGNKKGPEGHDVFLRLSKPVSLVLSACLPPGNSVGTASRTPTDLASTLSHWRSTGSLRARSTCSTRAHCCGSLASWRSTLCPTNRPGYGECLLSLVGQELWTSLDSLSWEHIPETGQTGRLSPQARGVVLFQEARGAVNRYVWSGNPQVLQLFFLLPSFHAAIREIVLKYTLVVVYRVNKQPCGFPLSTFLSVRILSCSEVALSSGPLVTCSRAVSSDSLWD